jgi:hypothetical protein
LYTYLEKPDTKQVTSTPAPKHFQPLDAGNQVPDFTRPTLVDSNSRQDSSIYDPSAKNPESVDFVQNTYMAPRNSTKTATAKKLKAKMSNRNGGQKASTSRSHVKVAPKVAAARRASSSNNKSVFGPVSTISTAPSAIGNSVTGSKPVITPTLDGMRVRGRDFLFSASATATGYTNWLVTGGCPITPQCMSSSALKSYANTYAQYQIHGVAFHFVTAVNTSTDGSMMFYVSKNREDPGLNPTSPNLLPFVLSDHCTVISPIWKNASTIYRPAPVWLSTEMGNDEPLSHQSVGEVFLLTKYTTDKVPGYVMMDYDITFRNMQVNIKQFTFPAVRMKYTEVNLQQGSQTVVGNSTIFEPTWGTGALLDGTSPSLAPTAATVGDIYKVIFTSTGFSGLQNAGAASLATMFSTSTGGGQFSIQNAQDGYTCYGVYSQGTGTGFLTFYPTFPAAVTLANGSELLYAISGTGSVTNLHCYLSLVGFTEGAGLQASY